MKDPIAKDARDRLLKHRKYDGSQFCEDVDGACMSLLRLDKENAALREALEWARQLYSLKGYLGASHPDTCICRLCEFLGDEAPALVRGGK